MDSSRLPIFNSHFIYLLHNADNDLLINNYTHFYTLQTCQHVFEQMLERRSYFVMLVLFESLSVTGIMCWFPFLISYWSKHWALETEQARTRDLVASVTMPREIIGRVYIETYMCMHLCIVVTKSLVENHCHK